ncbi:MAG: 2-amino-4-hydroxy-6-hydroxymethyldihydropteridine pyrophosphokinae [Pseudomonadota bacterium]|jgi:2-amino-4-hydroxy-6-hydroxymethyldihydropteridine diphosphokinase
MRELVSVFVGLGSNLGQSQEEVSHAISQLHGLPETQVVSCSSFYQSAPHEATGPDYINAVVLIQTRLNAHALLRQFQAIEDAAGRERPYRNAPRTLDVDMLLYGEAVIQSEHLTVPHPRMQTRAFVMLPLSELAPEKVPAKLLVQLGDQAIRKIEPSWPKP